jgi:hypothetical protein
MMNHLGKLVTINYLPDLYRRISNRINDAGMPEAKAVKSVCGVSYPQLGIAVARLWNFPLKISETMQPLSKKDLQDPTSPPDRLRTLTSLVKDVCKAVQDGSLETGGKQLRTIVKAYTPHLSVTTRQLNALVRESLDNVVRHAQALNLNVADSTFLDRLAAVYDPQRQRPANPPSPAPAGDSYELKDDTQLNAAARIPGSRNPTDIIMEGIQELSQIMMADYTMDTIAAMSIEILYRALDFQRSLMFIHDRRRKRMAVRFGYGRDCQQWVGNLDFAVGRSKDLFNLSIQSGKDLIVSDSYAGNIHQLIPPWYRQRIDAPSFIFLPLVIQGVCAGALYADRDTEGLPLSETEHRYLGMLRNQLILSIKYKQKAV